MLMQQSVASMQGAGRFQPKAFQKDVSPCLTSALNCCRLTDELHAQLRQVTAAAAIESAAAPAAAAAAARLAVFFPLHELLSLTQEAVSLATSAPAPEFAKPRTSSKLSRAKQLTPTEFHWVLQSGLDLADALIDVATGSDKSGGLSSLDHPYSDLGPQGDDGLQGGAKGGQEGVKDAWAQVVEGLLAMALTQHGDKAFVRRADMLLLRLSAVNGTKPAAAVFAR